METIAASARPAIGRGMRFQWEPAQNAHVLLYPEGMIKLNGSAGEIMKRCDGTRSVAEITADLERTFTEVLPLCVVKSARESVLGMVRMMRAGELKTMEEDIHTRQGRKKIQTFISEKLCESRFTSNRDSRDTLLRLVIGSMNPEGCSIALDITAPDVLGESMKEQIRAMLGGALWLTTLVWAHMDGYKPSWLQPFGTILREQALVNRAKRMIKRIQRQARLKNPIPVDKKVLEAMAKIPKQEQHNEMHELS